MKGTESIHCRAWYPLLRHPYWPLGLCRYRSYAFRYIDHRSLTDPFEHVQSDVGVWGLQNVNGKNNKKNSAPKLNRCYRFKVLFFFIFSRHGYSVIAMEYRATIRNHIIGKAPRNTPLGEMLRDVSSFIMPSLCLFFSFVVHVIIITHECLRLK